MCDLNKDKLNRNVFSQIFNECVYLEIRISTVVYKKILNS